MSNFALWSVKILNPSDGVAFAGIRCSVGTDGPRYGTGGLAVVLAREQDSVDDVNYPVIALDVGLHDGRVIDFHAV